MTTDPAERTRTPVTMTDRTRDAGPAAERILWVALYVVVVLGPLILLAVAIKPGAQGVGVVLAAGLGFGGLSLLVLQMLVSGRWTAITAAFGLRSVLGLHRQAGMAALVLVVAHVVVLMADDPSRLGLLDPRKAPLRAQAGAAAVVAMVLVALTSHYRQRLRLSYEVWRAVHVLFAATVLVGSFVHVIGVSSYLSLPAFRWGVLLLVVTGLTALFCVRVARPFGLGLRPFRVREVRPERGGAVTIELEADGHPGTGFQPGQFAWLKFADHPYGMDEHPFSLSSSADQRTRPTFTARVVGDFTESLRNVNVGTRLLVDGPHGEAVAPHRAVGGQLLLAAGIGITPALSVVRTAVDQDQSLPMLLLYGSRRWEDVIFREALDQLAKRAPNLRVIHVLSRPDPDWQGERGRLGADVLRRYAPPDPRHWKALVCGPPAMVATMTVALRDLGLPPSAVQAEGFG